MIRFELKNRRALITGGASGIGLETARMLAEAGADVAINFLPGDGRAQQALESLAQYGGRVIAAPGDLSDAAAAHAMVEQAIADLGGLDLLVNNAGTPGLSKPVPVGDLDGISEELWATLLNVNLMSVFRCSKAAATALKESRGAIVNTVSIAGFGAVSSSVCYSASKAAAINLTKNLARGLAPEVRVNGVAPGAVDSTWSIQWTEQHRATSEAATPLKRWATPADVAEMILYLGFGAAMTTGQILVVDGGISI